jgi:hemerythrin-like domain-containing protein
MAIAFQERAAGDGFCRLSDQPHERHVRASLTVSINHPGAIMPDVTELIEQDHREVEGLFEQFKASPDKSIAMQICDELDAHAEAEEKVFYPVVKAEVDANLADEGEDEHGEARQLIGRIKQTSDEAHLGELVAELEQAVQHHVQEEENEMLPKARETVDAGRLNTLGQEFQAAKG